MSKKSVHDHILVDVQRANGKWQKAGLYLLESKGFLYHKDYDGPPIDPINLNYKKHGRVFRSAHGTLGDKSLPNALYGMLPGAFASRHILNRFPGYNRLTDAQKLLWVGEIARSGMRIRGQIMNKHNWPKVRGHKMLAHAAREVIDNYITNKPPAKWALYSFMAGEGGARPKVSAFLKRPGELEQEYLIKLNVPDDPYDMARVEHFTHELALRCGVNTVTSNVTPIDGVNALVMPRYDAGPNNTKKLRITLSDLCGKSNNESGETGKADYLDILDVVRELCPDQVPELFRRMIFHAAINNNDNHLRNFELLYDDVTEKWELAPNYDSLPDYGSAPSATSFAHYPNRVISEQFIRHLATRFNVDPSLAIPVLSGVATHTRELIKDLSPDDQGAVLMAVQPERWAKVVAQLSDHSSPLISGNPKFYN